MLNQEFNAHGICAIDLVGTGRGNRVMLVQIDENSATLTPFGSLIRISPVKVSRGRSWTARLRAVLADLTWNRCCRHDRVGHDARAIPSPLPPCKRPLRAQPAHSPIAVRIGPGRNHNHYIRHHYRARAASDHAAAAPNRLMNCRRVRSPQDKTSGRVGTRGVRRPVR